MPGGTVLVYSDGTNSARAHEVATQTAVARVIAELKGYEFGGTWKAGAPAPPRVFFLPQDTLTADVAAELGIRTADDLFGGVVPHDFVKTKAITHVLVSPRAARPPGWSDAFCRRVAPIVLPGFTAFSRPDARAAARRLLANGPVRLKPALAAGSRGQAVVRDLVALERELARVGDTDLAACGVVLEANLDRVATYSVGQVTLDGRTISYVGTQNDTRDNDGREVYGGSDLTVVRGGWEAVARLDVAPAVREALRAATIYDEATACYAGLIASRRNYDVSAGVDARGRPHLGVLEQSWRIGGATPAEVAALRLFKRDAAIDRVRVVTVERYGTDVGIPDGASVHFHGVDDVAGPVVRYTRIEESRAA
jgi:hypothetical protein